MATINSSVFAQGTVTGSFVGRVLDADGKGIPNATVIFVNQKTGSQVAAKADEKGEFSKTSMPPGIYDIEAKADGYEPKKQTQALFATKPNEVVPVPFSLVKINANPNPTPSPTTNPVDNSKIAEAVSETDLTISLNPRRDGAFGETSIMNLPLGGTTLTRTFDELAFLVPGVNPPPQAIGNSVGPGVGGGVGTSGQFSVNGLRSRANNFTVDGSDNNDEDIGVRRQGFFTLVPQPIESVQEFQIITLLAPAEFGRNLGAQVNVLSKSGGNRFSGSIFGLFNSDILNAPNFFDNTSGNTTINLTATRPNGTIVPVFVDGTQRQETNLAGNKDEFNLLQGGLAIGGPIIRNKLFFFASVEGERLNATQERHFAVPTVEQRGFANSGSRGLQQCLNPQTGGFGTVVDGVCRVNGTPTNFTRGFPTSISGDAVFSLFPFPNNPDGVYGLNTYSQELSADARGLILSGKIDYNFKFNDKNQTFTARYNNTEDRRDLPEVGGALFSSIRPVVRTDNLSTFLSGGLSTSLSNEFRFSWGRTRLRFDELRDTTGFILPVSSSIISNEADRRFLLNARLVENLTLPVSCTTTGCIAPNQATYGIFGNTASDSDLGPIGQLIIAGFSPVGVDVFNFPQERKNNTFQFADTMRWQAGQHSLAFGADIRRTVLDSNLPRNSRPLVTFNGGANRNVTPLDLASVGAATGFFQSLVLQGNNSEIKLTYNQLNFFVQDEWRFARNLLLNLGVRYEYNTVPKEADRKIEDAFQADRSQFPFLAPSGAFLGIDTYEGFQSFLAGRTQIFDPDRNNFAPRIGFAWAPTSNTVIRGGYGIYYDQIIGAVVSQSRNVLPTFSTLNTGGGDLFCNGGEFTFLNPITGEYSTTSCTMGLAPLVMPGTLNTLNPQFNRIDLLNSLLRFFPRVNGTFFGATIPARELDTPLSHQYSIGIEQKLFQNTFLSVAYVGTMGRNLLRFTTPNLGSNYIARIDGFILDNNQPTGFGTTFDAFSNPNLTRPNRNIGPINQFETTGTSRYDSLQIGLRGRFLNQRFQYQVNYVYGSVKDDVSDVFDLAGAFALPQNSLTFAGEYAPANFDVRHRFTYSFIYDLPSLKSQNSVVRFLLGDWQIAGTGKFNTGQPFTVNSIFDVNFDGNLTDRLDNTDFITVTGDRQQPLILTCTTPTQCSEMLDPFGEDGDLPRNSFRAGNLLELDLSFGKRFTIRESQNLQFRVDVFNFINRANFGVPVRFLESPGFGQATDTVTPGRRIQFVLRYNF